MMAFHHGWRVWHIVIAHCHSAQSMWWQITGPQPQSQNTEDVLAVPRRWRSSVLSQRYYLAFVVRGATARATYSSRDQRDRIVDTGVLLLFCGVIQVSCVFCATHHGIRCQAKMRDSISDTRNAEMS